MQKFKKFIAVFVTMVMVMATGVVGFGATQGQAKLNVSLIGENLTGETGPVNVYRLMNWDGTKYTENGKYTDVLKEVINKDLPEGEKVNDFSGVYEKLLPIKDESREAKKLADELFRAIKTKSIEAEKTIELTDGKSGIADLDLGYYLISFDKNNNVQRALVELTEDKTLNLKTQEMIFTKESDSYTHEIGETIYYTITTEIPAVNDETFALKDTLSKGLEYVTEKTAEGKNVLKLNIVVEGEDSKKVDVEVAQLDSFELPLKDYIAGNAGKKLTIKYEARVKQEAELKELNTATLTYTSNGVKKELEDSEDTFTYPLYIRKIGENKNLLAGAKFELYEQGKDNNRKIPLINKGNGEYLVDRTKGSSNDVVSAVTVKDSLGSPNEKYNLKINGLRGDKEYLLVETEAPEGYNKLADPIKITIKTDVNNRELWSVEAVNGKETSNPVDNIVEIENNKGGLLPETGGMGTIIFTIVGLGLILAALGMRRTKKEQ